MTPFLLTSLRRCFVSRHLFRLCSMRSQGRRVFCRDRGICVIRFFRRSIFTISRRTSSGNGVMLRCIPPSDFFCPLYLAFRKKVPPIFDTNLTRVDLKSLRRWLSDSWRWQYLAVATCSGCVSKPLARIQRFWRTKMERQDYVRFLEDNLWIWREIPIEWIEVEKNLGLDEFERNMAPCAECGKM
jgi:hypothetical protein